MFKNINIGGKITGLVLGVVILTVLTISLIAYFFSKSAMEDRHFESMSILAELKKEKLQEYFSKIEADAKAINSLSTIKEGMSVRRSSAGMDDMDMMGLGFDDEPSLDMLGDSMLEDDLMGDGDDASVDFHSELTMFRNKEDIKHIYLTDLKGLIKYSNNLDNEDFSEGKVFPYLNGRVISEGKKGTYFSDIIGSGDSTFLFMSAPITDENNNNIGLVVFELELEFLKTTLQVNELGDDGELLLVRKADNGQIVFINDPKHKVSPSTIRDNLRNSSAFHLASEGQEGIGILTDYKGEKTLAAYRTIPATGWGLVVQLDTSAIASVANQLFLQFFIAGLIIIIFALVVSIIFSRILTMPLVSLKEAIGSLGNGMLPEKVEAESNDEFGKMAVATNNLVQALRRTADFAQRIGQREFETDFKPLSDEDALGNALISMRDSIQEAERSDKERNWIVTGVAEIGEILRAHNDLESLGDDVIEYVTNKIGAIQGAFYVVNDDDKDDVFIEIKASYAYNKKKHLKGRFKFAEGLVGQAAIEQDTLLRTEIPRDYVSITSGLIGERRPECILIVPLITNEEVYGVLEFAGFGKFDSSQVKFVQEISLITARTVFNIKVNERTRNLLSESQKMSHELQIQQEELRQNAEEMAATQEELKRTNQQLEERIEEVNHTQKRMQVLLENASEVITIYEEDRTVRYISPSVERILGYSATDLIGQNDLSHVDEEHKGVFENMFDQLIENPFQPVTIQYVYHRKDGGTIWLEATGKNMLQDPAIKGIILNSRDITERRRAEQEERMRSQMQALSENSIDLITRLNHEGEVFYINPMIEEYTGNKPEHFLNKNIAETEINEGVAGQWLEVLEQVKEKKEKVAKEMDFPSIMGDRVMQLNAIPEYNEDASMIESVLLVSHDITSRKLIELEIQTKNKKITESINYAKRIQGAILPNNKIIHQMLPDSFIMYKAKDVVSGDFPWYMPMGDDIFIAAVDCTGHGVPGALISLIGYFLLNDIVRSRRITDPGIILDQLDEGVTQTLRQDRDESQTKDGMDIALCKINLKKGEVEYAGAHRPLYTITASGEFNEIKGNKFPIGGGIYRNQTQFTNTKIKVNKGDSIFFCSDGFPDQFGGPDNRKFGPKNTRKLIMENHKLPMNEVQKVIEDAWEGWKGDYKQTDDVLMIGIKF